LPYKKVKRPILLQKATPIPPVKPTRNVIIEYEPLKAYTIRRVIEEGVFRVDPTKYINYTSDVGDGDVRIVDRIEDLPPPSEELLRVLQSYNQPDSIDYNASVEQLTNVTRSSNTPSHRQERVISSSNPSPVPSKTEDNY
jgi:hypothetical protein